MGDDRKKTLEALAQRIDRSADAHDRRCGVAVLLRSVSGSIRRAIASGGDGPAQVATPEYRANWDTLFGKKQTVGQA